MKVYFDNSASTKPSEAVIALMNQTMREDYANPSAKHIMGVRAEDYVKESAKIIASTLKVETNEIVFTSGGTESNNLALIGVALANRRRGKHIITTAIEHPAVYAPLDILAEFGFEITVLPVDTYGHIDLEELGQALREDTILVSTMHVNNEVGAIEPVEDIAHIIHAKSPACIYHVDAIQSYGKMRIFPKKWGIDLLSVSAHKLHGPKGVGFLYIDKNVKIRPTSFGGGQQRGMRSGTVNTTGIAGLGMAAKECYTDFEEKIQKVIALKDYIIDYMCGMEGVRLNSYKGMESAPHIVSISVRGIRSEVFLHALEERGIFVSSGSSCSSNHPGISGTLKGIGIEPDLLDATIRISLSELNTKQEAEYFFSVFKELVPLLRKFQ